MSCDQNPQDWVDDLVNKLQEHYGLVEEEARKKVEVWFESHSSGQRNSE